MRKDTSVIQTTELGLGYTAKLMACCGVAVLFALLAITCANIALRPFGGSIRGTVEISGYLCALAVGLCMPAAQLNGSHICAGLWSGVFSPAAQRVQRIAVNLVCAAVLGLAARELLSIAEYAYEMDEYIEGFSFSSFGMAVVFAASLLLHAAIFILDVIALIWGKGLVDQ